MTVKNSIYIASILSALLVSGCGGGGSGDGGSGSVINANYNFDGIWGVKTANNVITGPCSWTELTEAFVVKNQCGSASVGGVDVNVACNSNTKTLSFNFELNSKLSGTMTGISPTEMNGRGFSSFDGGACTNSYDLKFTLLSR
jgi:hypothetical protein